MSKIELRYSTDDEYGIVSFDAKHDEAYYKKYKMDFTTRIVCHYSISLKDLRYINWSDKTGFVRSKASDLINLCHKRPSSYSSYPPGFDHTSFWRKPGDRWPLFCLTEPYYIGKDDMTAFIELESRRLRHEYNLKFKVFPRSEKSLWFPKSTYMIFWWCPDYFDFEKNEQLLMSHENDDEFEKKCERKIWIRRSNKAKHETAKQETSP